MTPQQPPPSRSFWDALDTRTRQSIQQHGSTRSRSRDQMMCNRAGCRDVHIVTDGYLRVLARAKGSTADLLGVYRSGDIVDAVAAVTQQPHARPLQAASAVTVFTIDSGRFAHLCQTRPRMGWTCSVAVAQAQPLAAPTAGGTAARRCLLDLLDAALALPTVGSARTATVEIASQEEFAAAAGASRETFARVLRNLREAGLVRTRRNIIVVRDVAALHRFTTSAA